MFMKVWADNEPVTSINIKCMFKDYKTKWQIDILFRHALQTHFFWAINKCKQTKV